MAEPACSNNLKDKNKISAALFTPRAQRFVLNDMFYNPSRPIPSLNEIELAERFICTSLARAEAPLGLASVWSLCARVARAFENGGLSAWECNFHKSNILHHDTIS
jgi:hypothetical protein